MDKQHRQVTATSECLHLATPAPSQDRKAELLSSHPSMPWVYYLLGRAGGPWELFPTGLSDQPELAAKPEALREGEEPGGKWRRISELFMAFYPSTRPPPRHSFLLLPGGGALMWNPSPQASS